MLSLHSAGPNIVRGACVGFLSTPEPAMASVGLALQSQMICKEPTAVQYKFQVGQKFVILNMSFPQGANVYETLGAFFAKEHIPEYLHNSLLHATWTLLFDSRAGGENSLSQRDVMCRTWADEFRTHHAAFSSQADDTNTTSAVSALKLSPSSSSSSLHSSSSSISNSSTSSVVNDSRYLKSSSADMMFIERFRQLVEDKSGAETLHHLESSFALAVLQLRENRDIAVKNLQAKQQEEMNQAVQVNPNNLSKMVSKHVEQVQALDDSFKRDAERLQSSQRNEYRDFVCKYVLEEPQTPQLTKSTGGSKSTPSTSSPSASPKKSSNTEDARKRPTGASNKANKSALSSLMATITGDSSPPPPPPSSTTSTNVQSTLSAASPLISKKGSSASTATKSVWSESFSVFLGPQIKVVYNVRLTNADVLELCKRKKSLDAWKESARSVYSDSLTGLVLMSDPNLSLDTKRAKDLVELCQSSTEFHFESMNAQIAALRSHMTSSSPAVPLSTGDFVLTQHSNLNQINAVFHLALERGSSDANIAKLLAGLKNVLSTAAEYDISTLYIPILLLPETAEGMLLDAAYLKRAEMIVRSIKSLLSSSPNWGDSLRTIFLTVPTNSEQTFSKYHSMLKTML